MHKLQRNKPVSSKIFTSIILQRIKKRTEEILSEALAGFRENRSTIEQIFTLRQITEKHQEYEKELLCVLHRP